MTHSHRIRSLQCQHPHQGCPLVRCAKASTAISTPLPLGAGTDSNIAELVEGNIYRKPIAFLDVSLYLKPPMSPIAFRFGGESGFLEMSPIAAHPFTLSPSGPTFSREGLHRGLAPVRTDLCTVPEGRDGTGLVWRGWFGGWRTHPSQPGSLFGLPRKSG